MHFLYAILAIWSAIGFFVFLGNLDNMGKWTTMQIIVFFVGWGPVTWLFGTIGIILLSLEAFWKYLGKRKS